jgi:3-oxoacyl-[acyl-carrier-protein] synthase II
MGATMTAPAVAIAGSGAVTALGLGRERLEQAVPANASGLRDCPRLAGKGYQSTVGGYVPDEVWRSLRERDPAHADVPAFLLADAALREARADLGRSGCKAAPPLVSGGLPSAATADDCSSLFDIVPPLRRGLVLSTTKADITALQGAFQHRPSSVTAQRHLFPALLAADLGAAHDIAGPVQCVSTACVSGLLAIQQGALLIQEDKADLVFVAGVDLFSDFVLSGFTLLKSLDPEGCRPFDAERKGLSLGEGAGVLVLARRETAASPALTVTGWGSSNDANHLTGPSRDGSGLALAMNRALQKAGTAPHDIDFVHAHGTGTLYNDAMEGMALRAVFGNRAPPYCSSKGMFGHTLGAAGLLETIVCLIATRKQLLPGTPGLRRRDPSLPDSLLDKPRPAASLRRILKLNAGFAGVNAALVLEWEGG